MGRIMIDEAAVARKRAAIDAANAREAALYPVEEDIEDPLGALMLALRAIGFDAMKFFELAADEIDTAAEAWGSAPGGEHLRALQREADRLRAVKTLLGY